MALSKRDRNMLIALGVLLLGSVPYLVYAYPYQDYVKWGVAITEKQEELRRAQEAAIRLSALQEERKRLQEAFEESKKRLPERGELTTLDLKIQELLTECGINASQIRTVSLSAESPVPGRPYNSVPIAVQVDGVEWRNVLTFLGRIERLDRLIDATQVSITPTGTGSDRFNVSMTLETYVLPAE